MAFFERMFIRKEYKNYRWIIVGVSFTTLALAYGVWHSFSVFFVALLKEFGWSRSLAAGAFSLFVIVHGLAGPFVGMMFDRFGPKRVFITGALLLGGGVGLCSLIQRWWEFYLFYGLMAGMGIGFLGWIPNTTLIQQWFSRERGLAVGIISSGVAIGVLVWVPTYQFIISHAGWRKTYMAMSLFIPLVVISLVILFLRRPPEAPLASPVNGAADGPAERVRPAACEDPLVIDQEWASRVWTVRTAVGTRQFWLLGFSFFLSSFNIQSILAHNVAFFVDQGLEALLASSIVGVIGVASVAGKITMGAMSDRLGREAVYLIGALSSACAMSLLIAFTVLPSPWVSYAFALCFGAGYAVMSAVPPLIAADLYQGGGYGGIFGTLNMFMGTGGACGAWFAGFLFDRAGSYVPLFALAIPSAFVIYWTVWKAAPRKVRFVPGKRPSVAGG